MSALSPGDARPTSVQLAKPGAPGFGPSAVALLVACMALTFAACAPSADVEVREDGSYSVSARGYHRDAQRESLRQAQAFCRKNGLEMRVDDIGAESMDLGYFRVRVAFRCLEAGHPDLPASPRGGQ